MSTTAKTDKVKYFGALSNEWWDPNGKAMGLHLFTPFRETFILDELREKGVVKDGSRPLDGLDVLDVGCGAGLVTECLASLGANVTGIDASEDMIRVAEDHARAHQPSMTSQLQYFVSTPEEFALKSSKKYDVIVIFFVLEHIDLHKEFLQYSISMLNDNGSIFIHHLNKTWNTLLWILMWRKYVTKSMPKDLVTYSQLLPTNDVIDMLKTFGCRWVKTQGLNVNLLSRSSYLTNSTNYYNFIHAIKTGESSM